MVELVSCKELGLYSSECKLGTYVSYTGTPIMGGSYFPDIYDDFWRYWQRTKSYLPAVKASASEEFCRSKAVFHVYLNRFIPILCLNIFLPFFAYPSKLRGLLCFVLHFVPLLIIPVLYKTHLSSASIWSERKIGNVWRALSILSLPTGSKPCAIATTIFQLACKMHKISDVYPAPF